MVQGHTYASYIYIYIYGNTNVPYSFHNKLKTNPRYLAHQVNRRINDLVGTLLHIEEDLFFDRMCKEVMRDSNEASLKQEGRDRHTHGMEIPDSSVQV